MAYLWWFLIALLLAVVEVVSVDFFFLMLAIAAAAAGVGSFFGLGLWAQLAIFAVVSIVLLVTLRPWARRVLENSVPDTKLNFQALLGQEAVVEETVNATAGRVRLAGDTWTATAEAEEFYQPGEKVVVKEIAGASVVVARP